MEHRTCLSRRELLYSGAALIAGVTEVFGIPRPAHQALTVSTDRPYWRFCSKCHVMFSMEAKENACTVGGQHTPQGYDFRLPFDRQATSNAQANWRSCRVPARRCSITDTGRRGAVPPSTVDLTSPTRTFSTVLPHDVPGTPTAQTGWRFCNKCFAMFYDGFPTKGRCPGGEGHVAEGYNFVLPHVRPR